MHEDQKGFLEEIQSLSEGTKKRVLIIGTALIMIIVIGVWLSYFNSIIGDASQSQVAESAATAPAATAPPAPVTTSPAATTVTATTTTSASGAAMATVADSGLWQNIKNGFFSVVEFFTGIFNRPSNYTIQPK